MFKDRVVPPKDETRSGEKVNDKKENMKHYKGADDDDKQKSDSDKNLSNTTDKTEENVPTVTVNLRAAADLLCVPGSFPEAMIRFEVDFNTDYGCGFAPDDCDQLSNFPSGTNFHPILLNLDERLPLVDNVFQATNGVPHKNFGFDSFDSLDGVVVIPPIINLDPFSQVITPPEIPNNMQENIKDGTDRSDSGILTGSAVSDAPLKILRNEAGSDDENDDNENEEKDDNMYDESTDSDDDDNDIATITVTLRTSIELKGLPNSFPRTVIVLEVDFNEASTNPEPIFEFTRDNAFHDIIDNMEQCMHHVDERLFDRAKIRNSGKPRPWFEFESFQHLQDLLEVSKNNPLPKESDWMEMLLCTPGLQRIDVVFTYRAYHDKGRTYKLFAEDNNGVTVGQFVKAFRDQLQHAEADIRKFSDKLTLICDNCFDAAINDD
ncbi:uncharacterized protein J4E79_005099 [Alternaria viburni]|uniref:uncharacterized protein n=1 Tax=Alternaria viburni TaxID=566460 RepID=UPI0020C5B272|nr:uncharacterized protein J4E79_005099 [Alternaria viburni]KAI4661286.1 hypothetical protein J4E79_005099 [Alternaria viburni]